ncbi:MAG: hypothetical protein M1828_005171 [Chrysothrix sp. TS-e1954]|nr:MAG: hypothetical protein M1828_005171 [Chrysothrix sp. TS-e1954]
MAIRPNELEVPPATCLELHTYLVPGKLQITEYFFEVPWDYSEPHGEKLRLFARAARRHVTELPGVVEGNRAPWLVYLQGGPGFECRPPQSHPITQAFCEKGYQMLYLDMRGTGLSTPISVTTMRDTDEYLNKLKKLRADNIVRDCEAIRKYFARLEQLSPDEKWSVFGPSFGGFCCVTYLSKYPEGLREVYLAGGLPPVTQNRPDEAYARLFQKLKERNEAYYRKFPDDINRVKDIIQYLRDGGQDDPLPSGGKLTPRRFLMIGISLGFHGGIDHIHEIVLRVHNEIRHFRRLTRSTAHALDEWVPFDNNPLYAVMHEPLYCHGHAPNWSADRLLNTLPEFDISHAMASQDTPVLFTGEMIFPSAFADFAGLRPFYPHALKLASDSSWDRLYDIEQLKKNEIPVYAAVFVDDMYVDYGFSLETAKIIKGCRWFSTNRIYHDGIRAKDEEVVRCLWELREDVQD